jgi:hypothetical protein
LRDKNLDEASFCHFDVDHPRREAPSGGAATRDACDNIIEREKLKHVKEDFPCKLPTRG